MTVRWKGNNGVISIICKGYAEDSKKFLISHDGKKPTSDIIYTDANNSMIQAVPTELLDWVNTKDFNKSKRGNVVQTWKS